MTITSFRSAIISENSHKKSSYQAHKTRWGRYTKSRSKTAALNHALLFFPLSFSLSFCCSFSLYHFFGIEVHCSRTEIKVSFTYRCTSNNHTPKNLTSLFSLIFLSKHISLYALGRLKWVLDIIRPLDQHSKLKNQRNWLK